MMMIFFFLFHREFLRKVFKIKIQGNSYSAGMVEREAIEIGEPGMGSNENW